MDKSDKKNTKRSLFSVFMEDTGHIGMILIRGIFALLLFCILLIPVMFFIFKIVSIILIPFSGLARDITTAILFMGLIILICFLKRNKPSKAVGWIMTGHIEIEMTDENNRRMRALWLKAHKGKERTKPVKWVISLGTKTDFHVFETIYPVDKYGHEEKGKEPVCYRALVPVTHKFFGNLPVSGDTIKFRWITRSNNDINNLRVRAVEFLEKDDRIPGSQNKWFELDEKGTEGTVTAKKIETGKKCRIEGTVKLNHNVAEKIQLCFWYLPDEAEGESVFRLNF